MTTTAPARPTTTTTTGKGAALYSRLSNRPGQAKVMTVAEQERVLRADAERLGLPVVGAYKDNGVSAFKKVTRPGFGDLLAAIERGEVSHVCIVAIDRASRRVFDIAALLDACELAGVMIVEDGKVKHPADDALGMYLSAIVGQSESQEKSKRVLRAKMASLERGLYAGGRHPFGFVKRPDAAPGWWDQDPKQAKAIRDGFNLVMNGGAIIDVARLWNKRELRTSGVGNEWTQSHAKRAMLSPIVAGLRTSGGEVVGRLNLPDGTPWPAILTPKERDDLARVIRSRYPTPERWHTPAPALLSGILTCGLCGHRLNIRRYGKGPAPCYACSADGGERCGKVTVSARRSEADVTDAVLDLLARSPKFLAALSAPRAKGGLDPAIALQAEIDLLGDAKDSDEITMRDYLRRYKPLQAKLAAAQAVDDVDDRGRVLRPFTDALKGVRGAKQRRAAVDAVWADADLERHRATIAAVLDRVEVAPATSNAYNRKRLNPIWR